MGFVFTVKSKLQKWSEENQNIEVLYFRTKDMTARCVSSVMSAENYARWYYHMYTGKKLDLENPKTFDEKLWWLKLYNRDPLLTRCSDKNAVREYVKECGYEDILIPQLDVFDSVDELNMEKYNCEVVVKCNHNSGGHIFWDPKNPVPQKELILSFKRLKYLLSRKAGVVSLEWNYSNIVPKIVVEKVIRDKEGRLPTDYKFMCFDGEPKLLFLDLGIINNDKSYNHNYPRNIYDMNFNLMPIRESRPNADYEVEKPEGFEHMVEIARKLSQPFPHCRVDLYNVDGKTYFGELTFYHGSGNNNIQPEEWDLRMGSWIDLDSPKIVKNRR